MDPGRRSVLLGGASMVALGNVRVCGAAPMPPVPAALYQPGIEAMADTVRAIVTMTGPSIIGVDFADLRSVLWDGGRGGFGQGNVGPAKT